MRSKVLILCELTPVPRRSERSKYPVFKVADGNRSSNGVDTSLHPETRVNAWYDVAFYSSSQGEPAGVFEGVGEQ